MLGEHHDLVLEFPEYRERILRLKTADQRFARLFADYHDLDRRVRYAEEGAQPTSDAHLEDMKKQRLKLKDDLYAMLRAE